MLEHLVVYPRGGLCNRLRAIASAKRLCSNTDARCTVIWDWGHFLAVFDDDTEWIPYTAEMDWKQHRLVPGYHHIRHLHPQEGGNYKNRRVPVTTHPRIALTSSYVFCAAEEPLLKGSERDVITWFPRPHPSILEKVEAFRCAYFPPRTVGVHVRRTDHKRAILHSPDRAYFRKTDRLVDKGYHLFLATDNENTLLMMKTRYGHKLIHYPKVSEIEQRWPRQTSTLQDILDDIADLWLLASCEFVIGSAFSSYSRVAILFNGSPRCKAIGRPRAWLDFDWIRRYRPLRSSGNTMTRVFAFRYGALEDTLIRLKSGDATFQCALESLLHKANEALKLKPVSVADKPQTPPSGDCQDYLSFAPYFWPDPTKKDGLPYVRRDCQTNPENLDNRSDKLRLKRMAHITETLALAYYLTRNESYAEGSALQLRTWFLDPATRMNPHLNYAQVVPGLKEGRSFGVIDGHYLLPALDAATMLSASRDWTAEDRDNLVLWMKAFLGWLRTSKNGRKAAQSRNNHATLYDVQVIHIAFFVGNIELARQTADRAKKRCIAAQIRPDGSQTFELQRSESFFYSQYNLKALFKLAAAAEHLGVDLWNYQTWRGAGIRKALDFLMPYLQDSEKRWPYPGNRRDPEFDSVLRRASSVYRDERYLPALGNYPALTPPDLRDLVK